MQNRSRYLIIYLKIFAAILVSGNLLLTCANPFAPARADEGARDELLTNRRSPDEVLANFQYAYTFRDSLVYSELFDSSFTFISTNFGVTPPEPITWGRDQELKVAGRMFRFFTTLDLTWDRRTNLDSLFHPVTSDLVGIEEEISFTLTLDGGRDIPTLIGLVEFVFIRRDQDDSWVISRWRDKTIN